MLLSAAFNCFQLNRKPLGLAKEGRSFRAKLRCKGRTDGSMVLVARGTSADQTLEPGRPLQLDHCSTKAHVQQVANAQNYKHHNDTNDHLPHTASPMPMAKRNDTLFLKTCLFTVCLSGGGRLKLSTAMSPAEFKILKTPSRAS